MYRQFYINEENFHLLHHISKFISEMLTLKLLQILMLTSGAIWHLEGRIERL